MVKPSSLPWKSTRVYYGGDDKLGENETLEWDAEFVDCEATGANTDTE